jgi:hypothetical protein
MPTTIEQFNMFRRIQTNIIKCSFCDRYDHNILTCNDPQLNLMEDMLFGEKDNIFENNNLTCEERKKAMEQFIYRKTQISIHSLNRWRSFAIRKCGYSNNYVDNLNVWINKIVDYVFSNERPLIESIFNADFIAFNENDAVSYLIDNLIQFSNNHNNSFNCHDQKKFNIEMCCKETSCNENKTYECGICYEEKKEKSFVTLECCHKFCAECFTNILKSKCSYSNIYCSMCRNEVKKIDVNDESIKTNLKSFVYFEESR